MADPSERPVPVGPTPGIGRWRAEFDDPDLEAGFRRHGLAGRARSLQRSMYAAAAAVLIVTTPRLVLSHPTTTAIVVCSFSGGLAVAGVIFGWRVGRRPELSLRFGPITAMAMWAMAMAVVGPLAPGASAATCHLVVCGLVFGEFLFLPNRVIYTAAVDGVGLITYVVLGQTVFPAGATVDGQSALVMAVLVVVAWMTAMEIARTRRIEYLAYLQERLANERLSQEIASRQEIEAELSWLAEHDTLTDLLTRRAFFEQGEHVLVAGRRRNHPVSVLVIDADHFKTVNDHFGHHTGDEVLRRIARAIRAAARADDVVGRLGGEEFAVVMGGTDLSLARAGAEHLRRHIAETVIDHPLGPVRPTVSIGIAQAEGWTESLPDVLQRADAAMYRAKEEGRNRTADADPVLTPATAEG